MKLPCQNPNHPFKQKTYSYDCTIDDPKYCSSCNHFFKIMRMFAEMLAKPHQTLYGNQTIQLTRIQAHDLIDEVFINDA